MAADAPVEFREHVLADDLRGGYQVLAVDLTGDGREDLIALGSGMKELVWFENPGWERHILAEGLVSMINLDAWDFDGDGTPEIVIESDFSMNPKRSAGVVSVLKSKGDVREPWSIQEIDRVPTSHRIRWADIDGSGKKVAINAPLAGPESSAPDYRDNAPISFYRPGEWKREPLSDVLSGVLHGFLVVDWDGDGRDEILTASFEGIHLFRLGDDGRWSGTQLAKGNPDPWPNCGSSDLSIGHMGDQRFLAAIEPWHGNKVAVYREEKDGWQRTVIDESLVEGHALVTADLNGDGLDEIVAGFRREGGSVFMYSASDPQGSKWSRQVLDGEIAAASCAVADLSGSGRPDIACIGGQHLKIYENLGTKQ